MSSSTRIRKRVQLTLLPFQREEQAPVVRRAAEAPWLAPRTALRCPQSILPIGLAQPPRCQRPCELDLENGRRGPCASARRQIPRGQSNAHRHVKLFTPFPATALESCFFLRLGVKMPICCSCWAWIWRCIRGWVERGEIRAQPAMEGCFVHQRKTETCLELAFAAWICAMLDGPDFGLRTPARLQRPRHGDNSATRETPPALAFSMDHLDVGYCAGKST